MGRGDDVKYSGPKAPYKNLDTDKKYSWIKSPRWKEHPMETGPLARLLVGYAAKKDVYVDTVDRALKQLDVPISALQSAIGRTLARGLEAGITVGWMCGCCWPHACGGTGV